MERRRGRPRPAALAAALLASDPGQAVTSAAPRARDPVPGKALQAPSPEVLPGHPPRPGGTPEAMSVSNEPEVKRREHLRPFAKHLARRFLVSADAIEELVELAHHAGARAKLDPLLILAVAAAESSFNPIAESVAGAKGLMQVIPEYHPEKFGPLGGDKAVLEPRANILVGALVLREYLDRTGDLTALRGSLRRPGNPLHPEGTDRASAIDPGCRPTARFWKVPRGGAAGPGLLSEDPGITLGQDPACAPRR
jgi:hypothetical protein